MAAVVSRESYFETGLGVLSDLGYGGLKLAEVCNRLGVTTGSFYHYFPNWPTYTRELVAHWMQARSAQVQAARAERDPRRRVGALLEEGLELPNGAESAIRVWSAIEPHVHSAQLAVDKQRFEVLYDSAYEILQNTRQARVFASCAIYLFVGYEQTPLPRDSAAMAWIARQLLDTLDSGRLATVTETD